MRNVGYEITTSSKDNTIIIHEAVTNPIPINMIMANTCTGCLEIRYIPFTTGSSSGVVAKLIIDKAEKIVPIQKTDTPIQNHAVLS
jgi:hypothetical protein